ncbi:GtrA family protein [Phreatobacter sp.]|uniref:GtrA family protein n=1 Tax=Phreatobacter sp. TaxID=1966341 RepID=UPI0022C002B4|nr:GtrA family protein [Phreatobacter sp.]MCZ8314934.1 GtrA family protein [Phreatobacter sp.]
MLQRLAAFGVVGAGATAAYVSGSTVLVYLGVKAWVAGPVVYAAIVPLAYLGQRNVVFRSRASHAVAFWRYVVVQVGGLTLSFVIPWLVGDRVPPVVLFLSVATVVSLASFILMSRWTFGHRNGVP